MYIQRLMCPWNQAILPWGLPIRISDGYHCIATALPNRANRPPNLGPSGALALRSPLRERLGLPPALHPSGRCATFWSIKSRAVAKPVVAAVVFFFV